MMMNLIMMILFMIIIIINHHYYNKKIIITKSINNLNREDARRYNGTHRWSAFSFEEQKKKKKNKNYLNINAHNDIYNGIDMEEILNHYSIKNIFDGNKYNKKKLNGKQYLDYDEYEGFNCFPSERKKNKNK